MTDLVVDPDLKRRLVPSDRRLFLSYAWLDEEVPAVDSAAQGWVRYLYEQVRIALRHRFGGEVQFWRDKKDIDENRLFQPLIDEGLDGAALLLAVVSPGYLRSKWCEYERQRFLARYRHLPDGIERLIKVLKHRVAEDALPSELQRRQGYRFFALDPETGREVPFYFNGKLRHEAEYLDVIERLVDYLADRLAAAGSPVTAPPVRTPAPPALVGQHLFLALPQGEDTTEATLRVRCALEAAGLAVLSPPTSVASEAQAQRAVEDACAAAAAAIHVVGRSAGAVIKGGSVPAVHLQLEASGREAARRPTFRRHILVLATHQHGSAAHRAYLERLQNDAVEGGLLYPNDSLFLEQPGRVTVEDFIQSLLERPGL